VSWEDQVLRQVPDLSAGGFASGWLRQDLGDPLGRVQDPKKDFDQRRFASTVGAEQSEDFAAANLQRDILERRVQPRKDDTFAVGFGELLNINRQELGRRGDHKLQESLRCF
jgi:hypothetical protein